MAGINKPLWRNVNLPRISLPSCNTLHTSRIRGCEQQDRTWERKLNWRRVSSCVFVSIFEYFNRHNNCSKRQHVCSKKKSLIFSTFPHWWLSAPNVFLIASIDGEKKYSPLRSRKKKRQRKTQTSQGQYLTRCPKVWAKKERYGRFAYPKVSTNVFSAVMTFLGSASPAIP